MLRGSSGARLRCYPTGRSDPCGCNGRQALARQQLLLVCEQDLTLGMDAARHYAAAITLLRGADVGPVDPATLCGMDVPSLVELNDVRRLCARAQNGMEALPRTSLPRGIKAGNIGAAFQVDIDAGITMRCVILSQ